MTQIVGNLADHIRDNPIPMSIAECNYPDDSEKMVDMYQTVGSFMLAAMTMIPDIDKVDLVLSLKGERHLVRYSCGVLSGQDISSIY